MVVDDSFFMRKALERIFQSAGDIVVCEAVSTGEAALEKLDTARPDIITMDVEMPGMGGLAAVRAIMARRRTPILMLSSLTTRGTDCTLRALENGAADFVAKPSGGMGEIGGIANEIIEKVRALSRHNVVAAGQGARAGMSTAARFVGESVTSLRPTSVECIAIAISTGGPAALATVFAKLPATVHVPIVVVQHMPPGFTKPLAQRLNTHCALEVLEAEDGMLLKPGRVIIGAAGKQFRIQRGPSGVVVHLEASVANALYSPSADMLIESVAQVYGRAGLAFIMTGMGSDGAEGLAELKRRGGFVYGQDEASSTVYGMPRAAAEAGLVDRVISLDDVAHAIIEASKR